LRVAGVGCRAAFGALDAGVKLNVSLLAVFAVLVV
jgi:hypothetical protein